jgi:flagellar biosynthesis protein FliR
MMEYSLEQLQAGRLRIIALLATLPSRQTPAIPDALRIALALFDAEIARRTVALLDELAEVVR